MTAIETNPTPPDPALAKQPLWARTRHAAHFRTHDDEFDASKIGMWLFLSTEILLFAGLFVSYAIFRAWYPDAFAEGSHYLDWRWGTLNTMVLLFSSYTVAASIRAAQRNEQRRLKTLLAVTILCALAFLTIKLTLEYIPKWSVGKRPGSLFSYAGVHYEHEPIWWSIYYAATGIHAFHVIIGALAIGVILYKATKGAYGPKHYTGVEIVGLYWHLVDVIWIFLFPLLYLIH